MTKQQASTASLNYNDQRLNKIHSPEVFICIFDVFAMENQSVTEVKTMFSDLDNQILSIASPETVASTVKGIVDELSKIVGIAETGVEGNNLSMLISRIRDLLD